MQSCLTLLWTIQVWPLQTAQPAQLAADTLHNVLGRRVKDYTFVDFAAGAGGPTPFIEQGLNARLSAADRETSPTVFTGIDGSVIQKKVPSKRATNAGGVKFVLTDIHPHIPEWTEAAKKSDNLSFVAESVDATNAPANLAREDGKKVFRLYNLAFHHFDDPLARDILKNTIETADGFGCVVSIPGNYALC